MQFHENHRQLKTLVSQLIIKINIILDAESLLTIFNTTTTIRNIFIVILNKQCPKMVSLELKVKHHF